MKENLVIIGASGHGKVIAEIAYLNKTYTNIYFLDDNPEIKECLIFPVVGTSKDIDTYINNSDFIVAIGNASIRKKVTQKLQENKVTLATLIHPQAIVSPFSKIGEGTVVMAGAIINPNVIIKNNCIINTASSIDHDCIIEDYVHISVGAHLAGNVHVHKSTWVGAGATINNNIAITDNCMIGSGAVVIKDIEESGTYVGVPVRKL